MPTMAQHWCIGFPCVMCMFIVVCFQKLITNIVLIYSNYCVQFVSCMYIYSDFVCTLYLENLFVGKTLLLGQSRFNKCLLYRFKFSFFISTINTCIGLHILGRLSLYYIKATRLLPG